MNSTGSHREHNGFRYFFAFKEKLHVYGRTVHQHTHTNFSNSVGLAQARLNYTVSSTLWAFLVECAGSHVTPYISALHRLTLDHLHTSLQHVHLGYNPTSTT